MENMRLNKTALMVAALMAMTFGIAVFQLGRDSFWGDEAFTWAFTRAADPNRWPADILHPQLYYTLADIWVGLFGAGEFALRFPSVIFTVLTIPFVFLIGRVIHSPRAGFIAALLVATSPFTIHYAREARSYAMLLFVGSVTFLCLASLLKGGDAQYAIGSSARSLAGGLGLEWERVKADLLWLGLMSAILAAMFTHFAALLLPVVTVSVTLVAVVADWGERKQLVINAVVAHSVVLAVWLIHPYGATDFLAASIGGIAPSEALLVKASMLAEIYGAGHLQPAIVLSLGCVIFALWRWHQCREWKWLGFALLGCAMAPAISMLSELVLHPTFRPRSFIWTAVPFFVAVAVGLCQMRVRWLSALALCTLLMFHLFGTVMEHRATHAPWEQVVGTIAQEAEAGDAYILCGQESVAPFKAYRRITAAPRLESYKLPKDTIPAVSDVPYDTVWIVDEKLRKRCAAVLDEWGLETPYLRVEYGASDLSVRIKGFMSRFGVGYPAGRTGHVALYKVEMHRDAETQAVPVDGAAEMRHWVIPH